MQGIPPDALCPLTLLTLQTPLTGAPWSLFHRRGSYETRKLPNTYTRSQESHWSPDLPAPKCSFYRHPLSVWKRSLCPSQCSAGSVECLRPSSRMSVGGNGAQSCHLPDKSGMCCRRHVWLPKWLHLGHLTSKNTSKVQECSLPQATINLIINLKQ